MFFISWIILLNAPLSKINIISKDDNSIYIGEKKLVNGSNNIKPGTYIVNISGPYVNKEDKIKVGVFSKNNLVVNNNLTMEDIAYAKMNESGRPGGYISQCKDYADYIIICKFSRGSPWPVAFQYINNQWELDYYGENIQNKEAQQYYDLLRSKVSSR